MTKRLFDILVSLFLLTLLSPILILISIIIKIVSRKGPIIFVAKRAGLKGKEFNLLKFRTMNISKKRKEKITRHKEKITRHNDKRIFWFGLILRKIMLDETPQLINVLFGEMSIVGPRAEDISIVKKYYTKKNLQTLNVRPGIISPGSIFNYTHSHLYLDEFKIEKSYVKKLLPIKLSMESIYIQRMNFFYDLKLIYLAIFIVTKKLLGFKGLHELEEFKIAKKKY
jgi:lipopolysaccharide/colanic/teichoic acid biosynthesis glycosyltransferase